MAKDAGASEDVDVDVDVGLDADADADVAVPTPIAAGVPLGKIITADGREHAVYQPIPGFEHLFVPQQQSSQKPLAPRAPSTAARTQTQTQAKAHDADSDPRHDTLQDQPVREPGACRTKAKRLPTPKTPKPKSLKRRRSVAEGSSRPRPAMSDGTDDDDDDDHAFAAASEESHTFYIGDFEKLKQFLRRRFDELTMKPLRGIITQWIKQLEPRRLGAYGRYHKKLPSEVADEMTPPWWPRNVHYNEPSHLAKTGMPTPPASHLLPTPRRSR